ncbi:hypothetical protein FQR65_LT05096 [Abscondita terminalis]|nr:hypothetical protein FQR65_LT05096 [Abscondita terminalis]
MCIAIRNEQASDIQTIARLTKAAFQNAEHSSHTEQFIVNALRRENQLTVSLVAVADKAIVGHVAISPVEISSGTPRWHGLGPISVWPERSFGCVVLGDPAYYSRFGFKANSGLLFPGVAPEYFQAVTFVGETPIGKVFYHKAFNVTE